MPAERPPRGARLAGRYVLLCVVAFVVLFPIYTTLIGAFKPPGHLLDHPLLPGPFTLDLFREAWTDGRLGRYLLNSLVVASIITIGQLLTSVLSGYAFSMLDFPGRNFLFVLFISTMLVPLGCSNRSRSMRRCPVSMTSSKRFAARHLERPLVHPMKPRSNAPPSAYSSTS